MPSGWTPPQSWTSAWGRPQSSLPLHHPRAQQKDSGHEPGRELAPATSPPAPRPDPTPSLPPDAHVTPQPVPSPCPLFESQTPLEKG